MDLDSPAGLNRQPPFRARKQSFQLLARTSGTDGDERREALVVSASLLAISSTFNSLFKVLFIFPSRYLFAIGLSPLFSFR